MRKSWSQKPLRLTRLLQEAGILKAEKRHKSAGIKRGHGQRRQLNLERVGGGSRGLSGRRRTRENVHGKKGGGDR